ncbi:MAG: PAS domain S-box protein [Desulfobacteraceae bacterium]|nr:PAS domain S-box protein [Desulfobacteraceae bacterium]
MKARRIYHISSRTHLFAVLLLLFLLDGLMLWFISKMDHARAIEHTRATLRNTAVSLEERTKRTVTATNLILRDLAERIRDGRTGNLADYVSEDSWERLRQYAETLPDTGSLWLLDSRGDLLMDSTGYPSRAHNFSDREYFRPQKEQGIETYIGPIVKGRITNKYSFTISRRLSDANGEFAGIILAAIDTDDFTNFLGSLNIGEHGSVAVLRTDGALVLRQPMLDEYLGKNYSHLPVFKALAGSASGILLQGRGMDGRERMVAFKKVEGLPLVAVTGISRESMEREWLGRIRNYVLFAGIAFLALIGLSWLIYQSTSREEAVRRELEESERRHRSIFENSIDGILLTDPVSGRILAANPAACRIFGKSEEEICRGGRSALVDMEEPNLASIFSVRDGTGMCIGELTCLRGGDRRFPVEAASGIFEDKDGNQRAIIVLRDVTERKKLEKQLMSHTAKLEQTNRELMDFTSIASHDLKEPLRKIAAFGERIQAGYANRLDERGRDYLGRMLKAAGRMESLLEALLAYSRVSTRAESAREVDLKLLVEEIVSDLELRIEATGGTVTVGKLPVVEACPDQMYQLFQNILGNALKYHRPEKKPVVRIGSDCEAGNERCRIWVEDNGIGFEEEYSEKIFAPFMRLHGRSEYEGTGMGLAICRKIVARHGGTITATGKPGVGALFTIELPLAQDRQDEGGS